MTLAEIVADIASQMSQECEDRRVEAFERLRPAPLCDLLPIPLDKVDPADMREIQGMADAKALPYERGLHSPQVL